GENQVRTATVVALPGTRVTVQSGGRLEVNNGSEFLLQSNGPENKGGIVVEAGGILNARFSGQIIADGGVIRVKSGGMLRTSFDGRVIARNGGRILLEDGALVQLWGGDVDPEGNGEVWIQSGGTLEIEGDYQTSGNGFFHFSVDNSVEGPGPLKIINDNREHRRMLVDPSASVDLTGQEFIAEDARIIYGNGAGLSLKDGSAADVRDCVFEGGRAAIETDLTAKAYIRRSDFRGSDTGVDFLTKNSAGGSGILRNCIFKGCTSGVVAQHNSSATLLSNSYPTVYSSDFIDCEYGLYVQDHPSVTALSSSFTSNGAGDLALEGVDSDLINLINCEVFGYDSNEGATAIISDNVSDFRLDGGEYHNNARVLEIHGPSDITLTECVRFSANQVGIHSFFGLATGSTIDFNGSEWTGTPIGVQSISSTITITDTKVNSFAYAGNYFLKVKSTGDITMDNDNWIGQIDTSGFPNPVNWFDLSGSSFPSVIVNTVNSGGCGSDCQSPDDCRRFCEYYPENKLCSINPPDGEFKGEGKGDEDIMTFFPNPANGQATIANLPEDQAYSLTIFSSTGQVMQQQQNLNSPVQELQVSSLVPGFYILQLSTADGDSQQLRFSIVR
ncbi:MAG: T9SS type A sorting domain-containing protein, partial [Saprospiraceae bacterium]